MLRVEKRRTADDGRDGFTLVELLIALAISALVLAGTVQLLMNVTRASFITTEKLDINAGVRNFTIEMAEHARASNHFLIYRSIRGSDRDDPDDRLRDGGSGDFLLLVYLEPWPQINSPEHITKLVGYYRNADPDNANSEGPVMRFEKRFHDPGLSVTPAWSSGEYPSANLYDVEELMEEISAGAGSHEQVVELSRGLADGKLFYNYLDRSIMVKAEIIHGNIAKRITDTYNYTVSPRG